MQKPKLKLFIDGACAGNGTENAKAGWGLVVMDSRNRRCHEDNGNVEGKQTNNRAELTALLKALKLIKKKKPASAEIISDSEILVNGVLGKAKRKANRDIWEKIESLFVELRGNVAIKIRHVPREENLADAKAKAASKSLI